MDLREIMLGLAQQAGPRGYTYAGRVIPQGQTPDLKTLMMQPAVESPDAEGMGYLAAAATAPGAQKIIRYYTGPYGTNKWHVTPILVDEAGNEIKGKAVDFLGTKKAAKAMADKLTSELE